MAQRPTSEPAVADEAAVLPGGRLGRIYALTRRPPSKRTQRILLGVATVVFLVGGWFAFKSLDVTLDQIRWVPMLIAALVGVPLTLVANTFEYLLSARMLHHRMHFMPALQLTTMSTAANLLPIPGAFLVRVQGLRTMGSRYSRRSPRPPGRARLDRRLGRDGGDPSGRRTALDCRGRPGGGRYPPAYRRTRMAAPRRSGDRRAPPARGLLIAVELFAVFTNAGRLVLILIGLGVDADIDQALVLAVSSSLAAAAGILPGGFGLRESSRRRSPLSSACPRPQASPRRRSTALWESSCSRRSPACLRWLGPASESRGRMSLPNFLIIGAAKAGTNALYHYLRQHRRST